MNKNKEILKQCPNFYKIMNFDYFENDTISEKLITIYESFIFTINPEDKQSLKKVNDLDKALAKYIDDYIFRKEMKNELVQIKIRKDEENMLEAIVLHIIRIFDRNQEGFTKNIYISRWI